MPPRTMKSDNFVLPAMCSSILFVAGFSFAPGGGQRSEALADLSKGADGQEYLVIDSESFLQGEPPQGGHVGAG